MKKFMIILASIALFGCASTAGNDRIKDHSQDTISQSIVVGKSTKSDVRKEFGEPTAITLNDSGSENWTYTFARATPKAINFVPIIGLFARGADVSTKKVVILFDASGIAQKVVYSENESEVGVGAAAK